VEWNGIAQSRKLLLMTWRENAYWLLIGAKIDDLDERVHSHNPPWN